MIQFRLKAFIPIKTEGSGVMECVWAEGWQQAGSCLGLRVDVAWVEPGRRA